MGVISGNKTIPVILKKGIRRRIDYQIPILIPGNPSLLIQRIQFLDQYDVAVPLIYFSIV